MECNAGEKLDKDIQGIDCRSEIEVDFCTKDGVIQITCRMVTAVQFLHNFRVSDDLPNPWEEAD